jgi:VIT1/CCC1 family predicted Fe2+/Mn2+ transporter
MMITIADHRSTIGRDGITKRGRSVRGNALRAAVLGANDGLVSNLSLVMGVAGAELSNQTILITGVAGLLAGASSMALGEWLSVQSSRELYQRQIHIEAEALEEAPEVKARELAHIYQTKGIAEAQAEEIAAQLMINKESALDTLVREEIGVDPKELGGSAWEAAGMSFALFGVGAVVPVLPYLFLSGLAGIVVSLLASAVALFITGAGITLLTGRSVLLSGGRQVLFGMVAAALTFGIGRLLRVAL